MSQADETRRAAEVARVSRWHEDVYFRGLQLFGLRAGVTNGIDEIVLVGVDQVRGLSGEGGRAMERAENGGNAQRISRLRASIDQERESNVIGFHRSPYRGVTLLLLTLCACVPPSQKNIINPEVPGDCEQYVIKTEPENDYESLRKFCDKFSYSSPANIMDNNAKRRLK